MSLSQWRQVATFVGIVLGLAALFALYRSPSTYAANSARGRHDPGHQRFSRQPPAAAGRHLHRRPAGQDQEDRRLRRRGRAHGNAGQAAAREEEEQRVRAAGDLIGASPLLSALFHDEPTIESLPPMGLEITAVGNHEFDEGSTELLRMQNGGCHPKRRLPGPAQVRRRQVPLSRRQHRRQEHRQDPVAGLRGQGVRRHSRGLHRPHLEGDAQCRLAVRRRRAGIPRRGRDDQCAGAADSGSAASRPSSC